MVVKLLLVIVMLISNSESYRILAIFPLPSISHFYVFEALMKGLAEKGHEVDVVSHFPLKTPLPRYKDLSVRGTMPIYANNVSANLILNEFKSTHNTITFMLYGAGYKSCKTLFQTKILHDLKHTDRQYDLLITEIFGNDCMLGFAHLFNIPIIGITTSVNLPWGNDRIGNPDNPSYIPNYFTPFTSRMTFFQRLENVITLFAAKLRYYISNRMVNELARTFFGPNLPDLNTLVYNTSLIFVNSHFSLNHVRPIVPNLIEVGGLHISKPKPLPKHIEDILHISSKHQGVVYLSMGSKFLTETLPVYKIRALFEAFEELPYTILWKGNKSKLPIELQVPSNIHFEEWLPQLDVLCHPNTKLFITHGGTLGYQEAIFCGVPLVGIPMYADQELNIKSAVAKGLATSLNLNNITKESVLEAVNTALGTSSYRENTQVISQHFKDRPLSPLDTAIYWVEYVARYRGALHLRSVGADLQWYKHNLLDIVAFSVVCLAVVLVIVYYAILLQLRLVLYIKSVVLYKKTKQS